MGKLFEILDQLRSATKDGGFFDFDDLPAFSGTEGEGGLFPGRNVEGPEGIASSDNKHERFMKIHEDHQATLVERC